MFDEEQLVGFIINAVDKRNGEYVAFNTGTGVIQEYRRQRIVKSIYDFAIPELIKYGITKCQLEVITENEKAIKAYESIGFKIERTLKCFAGEISSNTSTANVKEVTFDEIDWELIPNQQYYSWDFHKNCLQNGNSRYYNILDNEELCGFFAINPDNGTLNQLEVFNNENDYWQLLFGAVATTYPKVRTINVDDRLKSKINAIEMAGLNHTVSQYEMQFSLLN